MKWVFIIIKIFQMEKNLNEQPNNAIEDKKPGKTYQIPLLLTLWDISEKAVTLNNNNEIINYLVDEVPENELKKYILYFLSKSEKIKISKHDLESCVRLLLEKSEEWKNIFIDPLYNWKYYYSLWFERNRDFRDVEYSNYRWWRNIRADLLVDKIKVKKNSNKSLQSPEQKS